MPTPSTAHFQEGYVSGEPPWVIGEPQPAVVALAEQGALRGRILDLGCGAGENTVLLAGLGLDVVGADAAPAAIERARVIAARHGVAAEFVVDDAFDPDGPGGFDTVLDSALFHIFDAEDRARYVDALAGRVVAGGRVVVLGLALTEGERFGPQITDDDLRTAFARPGWTLEDVRPSTYRGRIRTEDESARWGVPAGENIDLPAWLAIARRG